jgi:hypothetical protein
MERDWPREESESAGGEGGARRRRWPGVGDRLSRGDGRAARKKGGKKKWEEKIGGN